MAQEPKPRRPMHEYRGREHFDEYVNAIRSTECGTISPGGAGALIKTSRQWVHNLINRNLLETWVFYESYAPKRAAYIEVSVKDLILYGVAMGKIRKKDDLGLGFPGEDIDKVFQEALES